MDLSPTIKHCDTMDEPQSPTLSSLDSQEDPWTQLLYQVTTNNKRSDLTPLVSKMGYSLNLYLFVILFTKNDGVINFDHSNNSDAEEDNPWTTVLADALNTNKTPSPPATPSPESSQMSWTSSTGSSADGAMPTDSEEYAPSTVANLNAVEAESTLSSAISDDAQHKISEKLTISGNKAQ